MKKILGIDVGATGVKGAIVDLSKGEFASERIKYATPTPATPEAIAETIKKILTDLEWKKNPMGIGFPALVKNGICHSASNIDKSWINFPIEEFFKKKFKCQLKVVNDADAAGIAEIHYGDKNNLKGISLLLTLGTGIGSALFLDGKLVPNTELGHMRYKKSVIEKYASNGAREKKKMSWDDYGKELNNVLQYIDRILSPDRIILSGGISKKFEKYKNHIKLNIPVFPAKLLNHAGIIGAALNVK